MQYFAMLRYHLILRKTFKVNKRDKQLEMNSPLERVVVITAVLNASKDIERCIGSVQNQTYRVSRHIIVDGGSIDDTCEKVLACSDKATINIELIREADVGLYHAINKALMRYVFDAYVVLGSDDQLLPDAVNVLVGNALNYSVVQGLAVTNNGDLIRAHSGATLLRTRLHEQYGLYDSMYRIAADTKFLSAIKRDGVSINEIDDVVSVFSDTGLSSRNMFSVTREHGKALYSVGQFNLLQYVLYRLSRWIKYSIKKGD